MRVSLSNRALLRGMLAGAVVLTGTACSRSDRGETGRVDSAAVLPDTTSNAQPSGGVSGTVNDTTTGAMSDSAMTPDRSNTSVKPSPAAKSNAPRAETAPAANTDTAGYRPMERDTAAVAGQHADSARVTADTADTSVSTAAPVTDSSAATDTMAAADASVTSDSATITAQVDTAAAATAAAVDTAATEIGNAADRASTEMANAADTASAEIATTDSTAVTDTTAAGYAEMARDTSAVADQADSALAPSGDVALKAAIDTSAQADAGVTTADSTEAVAQVTTDSAAGAGVSDSTEQAQVRSAEDSTEMLGSVTTTDPAANDTADEQVVASDSATVATSETPTDEVGAAAISGNVTGADAVALMSRGGVRCEVANPEGDEPVRWDMSNTPATLNPCGMGSMIPSRIWTGQQGSGAAGQ